MRSSDQNRACAVAIIVSWENMILFRSDILQKPYGTLVELSPAAVGTRYRTHAPPDFFINKYFIIKTVFLIIYLFLLA